MPPLPDASARGPNRDGIATSGLLVGLETVDVEILQRRHALVRGVELAAVDGIGAGARHLARCQVHDGALPIRIADRYKVLLIGRGAISQSDAPKADATLLLPTEVEFVALALA
nr:hypothetical protein [Cupriavidus pauculus]